MSGPRNVRGTALVPRLRIQLLFGTTTNAAGSEGAHAYPGVQELREVARPLEDDLVDDEVVHVDLLLRELLHEALGLVEREELWDADAHERGQVRVLKLPLHL